MSPILACTQGTLREKPPRRTTGLPLLSGYAASFGISRSTDRKNRVLRAPATTFIITRSPSRSNGWDGLRFFLGTRSGRLVERAGADHRACSALLTCSATAARSTPTLIDYESGRPDVRIVPGAPLWRYGTMACASFLVRSLANCELRLALPVTQCRDASSRQERRAARASVQPVAPGTA